MKHLVLIATIWTALIVALATAESKALAQSKAIVDAGRPTSEPEGFTGPTTATLRAVDEGQIRAAGIRKLESRRLVLYTDLPSSPEIDELPQVFDRAFDAWCRYFGIDAARHANWRMRASLIDVPSRFESAGLIPADLPKFLNGYTRGMECWVNNQTSPYYRRHLLLHEGVHGFMFSMFGTHAPPWYMEGMAEMLATHRWQNGRLELPYFPHAREEVPKLGRIDIVQTDFANRHAKQLVDILAYDSPAYAKVEPYGWSWAAVAFLDNHPRYRERFRRLVSLLKNAESISTTISGTPLATTCRDCAKNGKSSWPISITATISIARPLISHPAKRRNRGQQKSRSKPTKAGKTPACLWKPVKATNCKPPAVIKWPINRSPGSASPAAFQFITSTVNRLASCWPPCDRNNPRVAPARF